MRPARADQILLLHSQGKSRMEIQSILGCSKSTISYNLSQGQKSKNLKRTQNRRASHPFAYKLERFKYRVTEKPLSRPQRNKAETLIFYKIRRFHKIQGKGNRNMHTDLTFTVQDVINKFGEKPVCYLTGAQLDIYKPREYAFDHIIPASRGGSNTIDNLGLCTRAVNAAKSDMTPDEFHELCRQVIAHKERSI